MPIWHWFVIALALPESSNLSLSLTLIGPFGLLTSMQLVQEMFHAELRLSHQIALDLLWGLHTCQRGKLPHASKRCSFPKHVTFFMFFFFFRKVFVFEETFINLGKNMEQKLKESSDKLMLLKGHRLGNRIRLNLVHDGSRMTSASLLWYLKTATFLFFWLSPGFSCQFCPIRVGWNRDDAAKSRHELHCTE